MRDSNTLDKWASSLRHTKSVAVGNLGEKAAATYLSKQGFDVHLFRDILLGAHLSRDDSEKINPIDIRSYQELRDKATRLLGKQKGQFLDYCEPIFKAAEKRGAQKRAELAGRGTHVQPSPPSINSILAGPGPDLIAIKAERLFIIEVKANRGSFEKRRLAGNQLKLLFAARSFGFVPLLVSVKVKLNIPPGAIKVQEI